MSDGRLIGDCCCQAHHVLQVLCHLGALCLPALFTNVQPAAVKVQDEDLAAGRHKDVALVQVAMQHARLVDPVQGFQQFVDDCFMELGAPVPSSALQAKPEVTCQLPDPPPSGGPSSPCQLLPPACQSRRQSAGSRRVTSRAARTDHLALRRGTMLVWCKARPCR